MRIPPFVGRSERTDTDYLTDRGARLLADRIEVAWAAAGHTVRAWPEPMQLGREAAYRVRTDLDQRGLPRR